MNPRRGAQPALHLAPCSVRDPFPPLGFIVITSLGFPVLVCEFVVGFYGYLIGAMPLGLELLG